MTILFKPAALRSTILYLLVCCACSIVLENYAKGSVNMFAAWLISINLLLILVMAKDKFSAIINFGRTPEGTLLWLAAAGGFPGLFTARFLFNHKTSKSEFIKPMWALLILQITAALYYFISLDPTFFK